MATKSKNRYFIWIIMGLLVVGLLGFGTGGLSGNIRNVGTVGDKPISVIGYQRALNEQTQAFQAQLGTTIGFQQAQALGIDQAVLAQLVTQRSLDNEASQLGVSVGDERVRDEVLRIPAFRGLDGEFDREAYRFALSQSGLSEAEFETSLREDIARTLLQGAVVGGVPSPDIYAETLSQFIGEARGITFAFLTADDLAAPIAGPTEADLKTYYDAHPEDFTKPEERDITYAWLTPDMIQDSIEIDEQALRDLYQERINDFMVPERRLVERLVYVDADAAEAAKATLSDTVDFDQLVSDRGLELSDVDLGDVSRDDLGANADVIFAANAGDVVGPLNTSLGPALFRMNAVLAAEEVTFEEAQEDLRVELAAARARRAIDDGRDKINDLIAGGAKLEDLAEQSDMQLGSIAWTVDNQDDIAAYEEFRIVAEAVKVGDYAQLSDLPDGGIFAVRLNEIIEPSVRPMAEVTQGLTEGWTAQAQQTALLAQATETAKEILPLTGFETLGLAAKVEPALTRRGYVEGTGPTFLTDIFAMNNSDVKVIDNGSGVIIVRLDSITPPDINDPQTFAEKQVASDSVAAGISQDIFAAFSYAVQARTDVNINQAALNAVHAQLQ
ncbi:SurA N-terminal domain-containing protein [bacterium]|nr:SurA N-terminal domain-containing protein [bacterium]